jgi:hypothetical protein
MGHTSTWLNQYTCEGIRIEQIKNSQEVLFKFIREFFFRVCWVKCHQILFQWSFIATCSLVLYFFLVEHEQKNNPFVHSFVRLFSLLNRYWIFFYNFHFLFFGYHVHASYFFFHRNVDIEIYASALLLLSREKFRFWTQHMWTLLNILYNICVCVCCYSFTKYIDVT